MFEACGMFSAEEMARRWEAVRAIVGSSPAEVVLCYGADRSGSAIEWLTGWPVTREAALVFDVAGDEAVLFVQHANHVPNAERLARNARVAWGGPSTARTLQEHCASRRRSGPVATIGAVPAAVAETLGSTLRLDGAYLTLRLKKSAEEIAALERGAALTDAAVEHLATHARPGMTEHECIALLEQAYVSRGGATWIHYLATTPMLEPARIVPAQFPSQRRLAVGDALVCEVSVSVAGYPGQLLRTFALAAEPTADYRFLHDVAEEAFAAISRAAVPGASVGDLRRAGAVVSARGCDTNDDLVHGFGGGYLAPVIPGGGRPGGTGDDFVLAEGMALVIQPNPVRGGAGVQTGALGIVTPSGWRSLQRMTPGMPVIGFGGGEDPRG